MALLPLHPMPWHYYLHAAPPQMTVLVFESVNLQCDNAQCAVLGGKKKINFFFPHPETNDTRVVWEIVMEEKLCSKCFSVKKNYSLLSAGDFLYPSPYSLPASLPLCLSLSLTLSLRHALWYSGNSFTRLLQLEMTKQKLEAYFSYRNNWAGAMEWEA